MHKKLASDLTSLAHSILQMKNKDDVLALKEKAYQVYEKLAVLAYVEEYINQTPQANVTKDELLHTIEAAEANVHFNETSTNDIALNYTEPVADDEVNFNLSNKETSTETTKDLSEKQVDPLINPIEQDLQDVEEDLQKEITFVTESTNSDIAPELKDIAEQPFDDLEQILFSDPHKNDAEFIENLKAPTLEDELKDTLSVDVMANLFEKAPPRKTINDQHQQSVQIDLNDRIAFVNHLFEGNQEDFNRVISQINTFKTEKEARKFILKMIKPEYDWSTKSAYELRLLELIERKFA